MTNMKFSDIIKQCFTNLMRRKLRSILSIIGVFIGVVSILATFSIGLAMEKNLDESLENMPGIRQVSVRNTRDISSGSSPNFPADAKEKLQLDEKYIKQAMQVPGVAIYTPVYEDFINGRTKFKSKYYYLPSIQAINPEFFPYKGLNLLVGEYPKNTGKDIVVSVNFLANLENRETYSIDEKGEFQEKDPYTKQELQELLGKTITISFDPTWGEKRGRGERDYRTEDEKKLKYPEYEFKILGIFKSSDYSSELLMSTSTYAHMADDFIKKNRGNRAIDGYFTSYTSFKKDKVYTEIYLGIDKVKNVKKVLQKLKDLGLMIQNPISFYEEIRKVFRMIQLVLGGIGAISLLVATIGVANTTLMTIYERTKEISIMKVIGANLKDIRNLFLFESGLIGFLGGIFGSIVALIASWIANALLGSVFSGFISGIQDGAARVSYIPFWLILLAILGSTCIGLIAGYGPSRRAMKMSALQGLRNE